MSENSPLIQPTLQHFGVLTGHLERMVDWYAKVVGMTTRYSTKDFLAVVRHFYNIGERAFISVLTPSPIDTIYRKLLQCVHLSSFIISLISKKCAIQL
jgi:hypothetical protein